MLSPVRTPLLLALTALACAAEPDPGPVTANAPPFARFAAPARIAVGAEAVLDASASFDPDGTLVAYRFVFGDGLPGETSGGPSAVHAWSAPGDYPVVLQVEDDGGLVHEARHHVLVVDGAVEACDASAPCPMGQACRETLCWNEGPGDACAAPGDCVGEDVGCYGGACTAPECHFDEDCGAAALCRGGLCQARPVGTDGGMEDAG